MSLLDTGPDVVTVYPEVKTTDSYGNTVWKPSPTGTPVAGRVQPSTSTESAELGQTVGETVRFLSRDFPAGPFARVEWDDRSWDVLGAPREHRGSPRTAHYTTYLRARSV
jgi:hypothetical protein